MKLNAPSNGEKPFDTTPPIVLHSGRYTIAPGAVVELVQTNHNSVGPQESEKHVVPNAVESRTLMYKGRPITFDGGTDLAAAKYEAAAVAETAQTANKQMEETNARFEAVAEVLQEVFVFHVPQLRKEDLRILTLIDKIRGKL